MEALRLAEQIDHRHAPSIERRVAFLVDQAKGYEQRHDYAAALLLVHTAEREAPEDMQHQPDAHAILRTVVKCGRRTVAAESTQLATRVGLSLNSGSCSPSWPGSTPDMVSLAMRIVNHLASAARQHLSVPADRVTRAKGDLGRGTDVSSSLLKGGRSMGAAQVDQVAAALTARTETRRVSALQTLSSDQRVSLGQFFTPERAAALIADLPRLPERGRLRVLDPGAGSGSLAAALAARVFQECPALELEIIAVEIDPDVGRYLQATLTDLAETARVAGVKVAIELVQGDYIELSTGLIMKPAVLDTPFDLVIMNPPYRKLGLNSIPRRALLHQGVECPNLYAAFLALGVAALDPGGQLVAITPRSFANGPYFGKFRRFLLDRLSLDRLHIFQSRSTVFSDTGVLQENIVFSGTCQGRNDKVVLSVSRSHTDASVERVVSYSEVVRPGDRQRFIRILADDGDTVTAETMAALPATLPDLNVQVSTGKVVDFRARENLRKLPEPGTVPLIYPGNVRRGAIEWPRQIRKDQAFSVRSEAEVPKFLLPAGFYVVVKRFSAKEERRRVVAAVWDPARNSSAVAFENHLNIFHANGVGLDRDLAVGLSYWLNSSIVDNFFRTFSGHTQVNATDLRTLRFPPPSALKALGRRQEMPLPKQDEIDELIIDIISVRSADQESRSMMGTVVFRGMPNQPESAPRSASAAVSAGSSMVAAQAMWASGRIRRASAGR